MLFFNNNNYTINTKKIYSAENKYKNKYLYIQYSSLLLNNNEEYILQKVIFKYSRLLYGNNKFFLI